MAYFIDPYKPMEFNLCKDNTICCDDDCIRCANLIYEQFVHCKAELDITRRFIQDNNLACELNNYVSSKGRVKK